MTRRCAALLGVLWVLASGLTAVAPSAVAAPPCVTPTGVYRDPAKWSQRLTDAKDIWPLTTGTGQVVAVVGTGVDPRNAQLAGRVTDLGKAADDCDGRGTFAAGIVAAQPNPETTFAGLAPGARVVGVQYFETLNNSANTDPDPNKLADAINQSVGAGATVVLVVLPAYRNTPALSAAVHNAVVRGVVVVSPALSDKAGVRSYPTSLAGVIGVGAIDESGAAVQQESGGYITVSAPGSDVVSTSAKTSGGVGQIWAVQEHPPVYAAAAYVAGAVALMRSYHPSLTPAEVADRLIATSDRPPSGGRDTKLGWGVLDVPNAVTADLNTPTGKDRRPQLVRAAAAVPVPAPHDRTPGVLAVCAVVLAVLVTIVVRVYRRGRARNWRV